MRNSVLITRMNLSGLMVHKGRAPSPLPGPTYLTFPQLTTTNQVRKHFQPQKILISGEKCGFSGLGLICSEVGHKNELSCRGVVVRTTSHCRVVVRTTSHCCSPVKRVVHFLSTFMHHGLGLLAENVRCIQSHQAYIKYASIIVCMSPI